MSYEAFQDKVNSFIAKAGGGISVCFLSNNGNHFADCSDGTKILGNLSSHMATVRWGSGHQAMIEL